ncbi:MAG: ABC transporter ATP-binding protein [Ignavibacteriales bacterium]
MGNILEVRNVSMRFGGLQALNDVSMSIEENSMAGLIGPNGAGKTTLFNIISGFLLPTSGEILFEGRKVNGLPPYRLTELGVNRTFQNIRLLQDMTVLHNVQLGYHCQTGSGLWDVLGRTARFKSEESRTRRQAMEVLDFVGLAGYSDELARNLSYGLQRKLEIARSIATGARLLLLDEPSAGMNSAEKDALAVLIREIHEKLNRTVLLIEHDMRLVMRLSEKITVLNQGERIAEGDPAQIQSNPRVIEAYLGRSYRGGEKSA